VIDPLGEVLYHMKDIEDISTINLEKETLEKVRTHFPFWKDADKFGLL
jgi:omega-amidase